MAAATGLVINANKVANRGPQVDLVAGDMLKADSTRTTIGGGVNGAYLVIANAVKVGFRPLLIPEQMPQVAKQAGHIPNGVIFWTSQPIVFTVEQVRVLESNFAGSGEVLRPRLVGNEHSLSLFWSDAYPEDAIPWETIATRNFSCRK